MINNLARKLGLVVLLAVMLTVAVAACSGGSDESTIDVESTLSSGVDRATTEPSRPTPIPTKSSATSSSSPERPTAQPVDKPGVSSPTPTPTRSPGAVIAIGDSPFKETDDGELMYAGDVVEIIYSRDWRASDRTANSVTFTHVSSPGDALITVRWEPNITNEVVAQYTERLQLFAADIVQLENTTIDGVTATRTLIVGPTPDGQSRSVVLATVAIKSGMGVMVVFAAPEGLFESLIDDAEEFIASIEIR